MSYLEKFSDEELLEIFGSDVEAEIKARGYKYGWYKPTEYAGEIYILVNPAFSDLVKIGYANDVEKRVKSFNRNSGLPDPYHIYATYKVKKRLEDLKLHNLIDSLDSDLRHAKNREFYEMSPEKAYGILSAIAQINGDEELLELNPLQDDFFDKEVTVNEKSGTSLKKNCIPDGRYRLDRKKKSENRIITAFAEVKDGEWTILKGSDIALVEDKGLSEKARSLRTSFQISEDGKLISDVPLGRCSPSFAGALVINQSCNGWAHWRDEKGQPIELYRALDEQ